MERTPGLSQVFALLGKSWTAELVAALGDGGLRFSDFAALLGISDSMLSTRLRELEANGVVLRRVDVGPPIAVHYELSDLGSDLVPRLHDLGQWALTGLCTTPGQDDSGPDRPQGDPTS